MYQNRHKTNFAKLLKETSRTFHWQFFKLNLPPEKRTMKQKAYLRSWLASNNALELGSHTIGHIPIVKLFLEVRSHVLFLHVNRFGLE